MARRGLPTGLERNPKKECHILVSKVAGKKVVLCLLEIVTVVFEMILFIYLDY